MYTVFVIGGMTAGRYEDATRSKYGRHEWEEALGHAVPSDCIYYSMVNSGSSAKGQSVQWRGRWALPEGPIAPTPQYVSQVLVRYRPIVQKMILSECAFGNSL